MQVDRHATGIPSLLPAAPGRASAYFVSFTTWKLTFVPATVNAT